jgi:hypothetical protein
MTQRPETDPLAELPWPKPVVPSVEISSSIHDQCTCDLARRRGMSGGQRLALSVALSLGVFTLLAALTRDQPRFEGTFKTALLGAAGWGLVQAAVLWMGLARPPGKRASRALRLVVAVTLPVLFLAYIAFAAPEWVSFSEFAQGARASHAVSCGLIGLLFGALVSGGVLLLWRGTDPLSPGLTGALAGLVGGVGGALAIGVACPSQEGWHACFSHGLGVLAFAVFGCAVGRRLLSP